MNILTIEKIFKVDGVDYIVLPFKSYLINLMDLGEDDKTHLKLFPGWLEFLDAATQQGYGYVVLGKGKPVLCFGVVSQWEGVSELWLIPDQTLIRKHRIQFHKGALAFMELVAKELSLHRLQVTVSSRNVLAVKWIKSLYFKEEGILKNYGIDKSDYIMFARLF